MPTVIAEVSNASALGDLATQITSSFPISEITSMVGICVGAGASLFILWFGARKLVKVVTTAFRSGKIRF